MDTGVVLGSSPPQHHSPLMSRRNGGGRGSSESSDIHICVLCLRALMNNSVSFTCLCILLVCGLCNYTLGLCRSGDLQSTVCVYIYTFMYITVLALMYTGRDM